MRRLTFCALLIARFARANWRYTTTCNWGSNTDGYTRGWIMSHNEDPNVNFQMANPSGYMNAFISAPFDPGFFWYATTCPIQKPFDASGLMYNLASATEAAGDGAFDVLFDNYKLYLCSFARLADLDRPFTCIQYLFRCPTCKTWQTPLGGCAGLAHSSVWDPWSPCVDCGSSPGVGRTNQVWRGPTCAYEPWNGQCTTQCTLVTCPDGYWNNNNANSDCTPCTPPTPDNALWTGTCEWKCAPGQYYEGGASCVDCPALPTGAVMDGKSVGGGRDISDCRLWNCPKGNYLSRSGTACLACATDWYQSKPSKNFACEGKCYAKLLGQAIDCPAGYYPVFDAIECGVSRCAPCTGAPPAGSYWGFDALTGWSAYGADRCVTQPCPNSTRPEMQYVGCGGVSPGISVPCTNLNVWYGDSGNTTIQSRYYVLGDAPCTTDACAACSSSVDMYNPLCPAKRGPSTQSGACTMACSNIINGYHIATRVAPIASPDDCPFACYPGYTPTQRTCTPCANSSSCNAGYYVPKCGEPCQACTNPYTGGPGRWRKISAATYESAIACQWICNVGYYKDSARTTCATCTTTSCSVGAYRKGQCLVAEDAVVDSTCEACDGVANALLTGPGWLSADTCAFQCNAGFFANASRQCAPWTPSGNCPNTATEKYNWTGGTPTVDQHCVLCPNLPKSHSRTVQWAQTPLCTWTCAAGYYLAASLTCVGCPPGTYGNASGLPCADCADGTYNSDVAAQWCEPVPGNSTRLSGGIGFQCLPSFQRDPRTGVACEPCVTGAADAASALKRLNMVSAAWNVEKCSRSAFACAQGYYRVADACAPCPTLPTGALSGGSSARAVSLCGAWPSCPSPADEVAAACAPSACTSGYYLVYGFFNASDTAASVPSGLCFKCTDVQGCGEVSGYNLSPCQGGQQQNPCVQCAALPSTEGLLYLAGSACNKGCAAGYAYASESVCVACPNGTYQSITGVTAPSCTLCAVGTYSGTAGASACLPCAPGWRAPIQGAAVCEQCSPGTYASAAGAGACSACPAGAYALACATACVACPPETPTSTGAACVAPSAVNGCPGGFFRSNASVCVGCPEGTYCPANDANAPYLCPPGTPPAPRLSTNASACNAGASGAWRAVAGDPVPCPANTSTYNLTGATSSAWCYPLRGYYGLPGATAQPCPYDAYCPPPARTFTPCPSTAPFAPMLSTSTANCTSTMRQPCRPGYYVSWDALSNAACQRCPNGSYCLGQVWPNGTRVPSQTPYGSNVLACSNASSAWYTDAGAYAASMCRSQSLPSFSLKCPDGTIGPIGLNIVSQLQCRASPGFYALPSTLAATDCPRGNYCPKYSTEPQPCVVASSCDDLSTQISINPCDTLRIAVPGPPCVSCSTTLPSGGYWATNCLACCNAGYYPSGDACIAVNSTCTNAGYYRPAVPACASTLLPCTACPAPLVAGAVSVASAAGVFDVAACRYACPSGTCNPAASVLNATSTGACALAPPGYYAVAGVCAPCAAGTYRYESGGTACLACPANASATGAAQTLCVCAAGQYALYANGMQQCAPCPAGTVVVASACQTCDAGTAWTPFSPWLTGACGPGTFRATPASACQPCALGTYAAGVEATACVACATGTYASAPGRSTCATCTAAGTYAQPYYGCVPCPMNGSAAAQCACPAGTFLEGALCLGCASRCVGNGTFVVARTRNTSGCTVAGVDASDFACAVSPAACPEDTYYDAAKRTCVACRRCPALATAAATCAVNSTRDTTRCVCPLGYYYRWGDCFPCTRTCGPYAVLASLCALGATDDTSVCACAGGGYGNGVRCVCPALTYRHPNGTCVACLTCGPNASYAAICLEGATADTTRCVSLACGSGAYANATTSSCLPCGVGTFAAYAGATACVRCVSGTYASGNGAQTCASCANGTYASGVGSTICHSIRRLAEVVERSLGGLLREHGYFGDGLGTERPVRRSDASCRALRNAQGYD